MSILRRSPLPLLCRCSSSYGKLTSSHPAKDLQYIRRQQWQHNLQVMSPGSLHRTLTTMVQSFTSANTSDDSRDPSTIINDPDWDNLGFQFQATDHMFVMKCDVNGEWYEGELKPFGFLKLSPSAGVLNYGQGLFEGLKAQRTEDGRIVLFCPEENAKRMQRGAQRLCMPAPPVHTFVEAVKQTTLANKRWVPPFGKGSLYIRPLLIGSGAVLGPAPSPEYTFLVFASPVGNYFKEGANPIHLKTESVYPRAVRGGTGGIKTICNYAPVQKAQLEAKARGFSDVVYVDALEKKYVEEVSSCNIFLVKDNIISTPESEGTILPGITRQCMIELAQSLGYKVEERRVPLADLLDADEVFCTGTAVVVAPVGSITHEGERVSYSTEGTITNALKTALTDLQVGKTADTRGWILPI